MPMFNLQNTKFVLPTANSIPITLNGGMKMPGWSDVYSLDKSSNEDRAGFESSSNRVKSLIQKEVEAGIPEEKIVLAGFSQGGALALHTSLRYPKKLAGCVALSTWVPLNSDYPGVHSETQKNLPILQVR
jgi:predicted esterase